MQFILANFKCLFYFTCGAQQSWNSHNDVHIRNKVQLYTFTKVDTGIEEKAIIHFSINDNINYNIGINDIRNK